MYTLNIQFVSITFPDNHVVLFSILQAFTIYNVYAFKIYDLHGLLFDHFQMAYSCQLLMNILFWVQIEILCLFWGHQCSLSKKSWLLALHVSYLVLQFHHEYKSASNLLKKNFKNYFRVLDHSQWIWYITNYTIPMQCEW